MATSSDLRARREALGLTLDQVHADTRIPLPHLTAIEEGRLQDLPDGPWGQGYVRAYRERLGLPPDAPADGEEHIAVPARASRVPLAAVRVVAGAAALSLLGLIAWQLRPEEGPEDAAAAAAAAEVPDQLVRVRANRTGPIRILVDGEVAVDRVLANGEQVEVVGKHRVEVELPSSEAAKVDYNGETIVPQGRQDEARRLVFIDDLGARP